jgi:thioesterase domain-containing protein
MVLQYTDTAHRGQPHEQTLGSHVGMLSPGARLCRLQQIIHTEIPITRAIGITVAGYDQGCLTLRAPAACNLNHNGTVFSGSLNAVVTVAGWGLLWLVLQEEQLEGNVVIQDSSISYLGPIKSDFCAYSSKPVPSDLERFLYILRRKGKARSSVQAAICERGETLVTFSGRYVVHLRSTHLKTSLSTLAP